MKHPFAELLGFDFVEQSEQFSHCYIEVRPELLNPLGVVHGAVFYALADTGMGGALLPSLPEGQLCATIEIKMSYFKAVREGRIDCKTKVVNQGKRVVSLESELFNNDGLVVKATGSFSIFTPS